LIKVNKRYAVHVCDATMSGTGFNAGNKNFFLFC
jgi:hypothetical protein